MKPRIPDYKMILGIILVFFAISLSNQAHADDSAIQATFMNFSQIQFGDTVAAPWRIVQAKNWKDALKNKKSIAEGMSDAASVASLSKHQREALYQAWLKTPQDLWVIYFPQPDHLQLQAVSGGYQIELVPSLSDAEQAQRDAAALEAIDAQKPIDPNINKQADFDAKAFTKDFRNWQQRFKQDISTFEINMHQDPDFGRKLVEDKNSDALKQSYAQSIDTGHKGLSLRDDLISAYYAPAGHEGTEVTPSGDVITQLLLSEKAKPVGFGGIFTDEGNTVELWYMVFDDMSDWTKQDFNESFNFKAFSPAALPPYQTIKRNSWPALVFTRNANGNVKLYGMSMELSRILGTIYNAQLF